MPINLPSDGLLVGQKTGRWTTAMWAWMRDISTQAAGSAAAAITALTGDVTATGPGSVAATIAALAVTTAKIAADAVTFAKLQNIATQRLIGRNTAGSGDPEEVTITQALDWLP